MKLIYYSYFHSRCVDTEHASIAGMMAALFLVLGIVCGVNFTFFVSWLVESKLFYWYGPILCKFCIKKFLDKFLCNFHNQQWCFPRNCKCGKFNKHFLCINYYISLELSLLRFVCWCKLMLHLLYINSRIVYCCFLHQKFLRCDWH